MDSIKAELVVVGGGPGGYAAAFYAADQGKKVILVERDSRLGGVCLNRGCIPSKAYLHATKVMAEAKESSTWGINFQSPLIDTEKLRGWKNSIVTKLAGGVSGLAKARGVEVLHGRGHFEDSHELRVETSDGQRFIQFEHAIIAVGSSPALPKTFDLGNPRIMTSDAALEIESIPENLLVVGAGYIGMELGTVYAGLGSKIVMVEALDRILLGADKDLTRPVLRYCKKAFKELRLSTKVKKMATSGKQIKVTFEVDSKESEELFDKVLVSVGRSPNTKDLGLKNTKIVLDEKGFIKVNSQLQTEEANIYAIGDVVGGALLAHKASKEARIAVENILGDQHSVFEDITIPAVIFTDPEIAWCGLTEDEAKTRGIEVKAAKFSWGALGRALTLDYTDGLTKLIVEPDTDRILGVGIVGPHAGDLISEGVLAVEMGATVKDLAEVVHPHPTLSESLLEAAEVFYGHSTHMFTPKRPSVEEPVE